MRKTHLTILFLLVYCIIYAQSEYSVMFESSECEIEGNYAGFEDRIKGKEIIYSGLKDELEIRNITNRAQLEKQLTEYLMFFNDNHPYIWSIESNRPKKLKEKDNSPVFKLIDSVAYISIPSFSFKHKEEIDSLIKTNYSTLLNVENLIIDVRGNGGGQDPSFCSLIPLIYTNLIFIHNLEFFVTKSNKTQRLDSTLQMKNEEKFLPLFGENKFVVVYDSMSTLRYPKNVAIIIDSLVGSTTEQFLLYAKQSKKVKLFGNNSSGGIDYSNLRYLELIKDSLYVSIPMTRSMRLPKNRIDECGIQSDFYLRNIENKLMKS